MTPSVVNERSREPGGSQPSIRGTSVINERAKGEIQARAPLNGPKEFETPSHLFQTPDPNRLKKSWITICCFKEAPARNGGEGKASLRTVIFCCCFINTSNVTVTIK